MDLRPLALLIGLVAPLLFSGCNTAAVRVLTNYEAFSQLDPKVRANILRGRIELGYTPDTIAEGRGYVMTPGFTDKAVQDTDAAIQELKTRGAKKVGVTGYCWGGTISWLAATRLKPDAVSGYYGGGIHGARNEKPTVPTQLHFGDKDMHIPMTHVNELRELHPNIEIFDYPADHGFHCDERGSWDAAASKTAMERTMQLFSKFVNNG